MENETIITFPSEDSEETLQTVQTTNSMDNDAQSSAENCDALNDGGVNDELLLRIADTLDKIYYSVSENSVSANNVTVTVDYPEVPTETEAEVVSNPLITTKLSEYGLTDSLLLVIALVLLLFVFVTALWHK